MSPEGVRAPHSRFRGGVLLATLSALFLTPAARGQDAPSAARTPPFRVVRAHVSSGSLYLRAISPDRATLAAAGDALLVLDSATGRERLRLTPRQLGLEMRNRQPFPAPLFWEMLIAALSPRGETLAVGGGEFNIGGITPPYDVTLRDIRTGQTRLTLAAGNTAAYMVAMSPDGGMLAASGPYVNYDALRERQRQAGSGDPNQIQEPYNLPPGLRCWDTHTGRLRYQLAFSPVYRPPVFSPNGRRLATFERDAHVPANVVTTIRDAATGRALCRLENGCLDGLFSPDGKRFYTGCWTPDIARDPAGKKFLINFHAAVFDTATGKRFSWLEDEPQASWIQFPAWFVDVSPDGRYLLTHGGVTDTRTGKLMWTIPRVDRVSAGFFSADSRHLYTANDHGDLLEWDLRR